MEKIDDDLDTDKIFMVKCSDSGAGESFGILDLPAIGNALTVAAKNVGKKNCLISVYIQNGVPNIYPDDDLSNAAQILSWVEEESKVHTILAFVLKRCV